MLELQEGVAVFSALHGHERLETGPQQVYSKGSYPVSLFPTLKHKLFVLTS